MPPIQNHFLYVWRIISKWISFFVFGVGSLIIVFVMFPIMRLCIPSRILFQKRGHALVSGSFRLFVAFMSMMGIVRLETDDREAFRRLGGTILVANHPSLLDIVMLISLIPNATCLVSGKRLGNIIMRGIIKQLYIPNTLDFHDLQIHCAESLARGNCLVIFPEGTRTPRSGAITVKKGAARLALFCGRPIVPCAIGGTDKWGLGRKDPWIAFNHTDRYVYTMRLLPSIHPYEYVALPRPAAVKNMNEDIKDALFQGSERNRVV